jgi:hypothetical protein
MAVFVANDSVVVVLDRSVVAVVTTELETLVTLHDRQRRYTHMSTIFKYPHRRAGVSRVEPTALRMSVMFLAVYVVVIEVVITCSEADND